MKTTPYCYFFPNYAGGIIQSENMYDAAKVLLRENIKDNYSSGDQIDNAQHFVGFSGNVVKIWEKVY